MKSAQWEVMLHVFIFLRVDRFANRINGRLTASMFSRVRVLRGLPQPVFSTEPFDLNFDIHNITLFRSRNVARGASWKLVREARWTSQ